MRFVSQYICQRGSITAGLYLGTSETAFLVVAIKLGRFWNSRRLGLRKIAEIGPRNRFSWVFQFVNSVRMQVLRRLVNLGLTAGWDSGHVARKA